MNIGEAAGWAAVLASRSGVAPAELDSDRLVRVLAENRSMVGFFNDVDLGGEEDWIPGVCYFGTKGFFPGYDARPLDSLDPGTAGVWTRAWAGLREGSLDPMETARAVAAESGDGPAISVSEFWELLESAGLTPGEVAAKIGGPMTRGEACRILFEALQG